MVATHNIDILQQIFPHHQPFGPIITERSPDKHVFFLNAFHKNNKISKQLETRPTFILGRRGAGKTQFLTSFRYNNQYDFVIELSLNRKTLRYFRNIESVVRSQILDELSGVWQDIFWTALFMKIRTELQAEKQNAIPEFDKYLGLIGINERTKNFFFVVDVMLDILSGLNKQWKHVVSTVRERLDIQEAFDQAEDACTSYLRNEDKTAIVIIDWVDDLSLDDPTIELAVKGLISGASQFAQDKDRVFVHCCLPNEIFPKLERLTTTHTKKVFYSKINLQWDAIELLQLSALRLRSYLKAHDIKRYERQFAGYRLEDPRDLIAFWHEVIPKRIRNRFGREECSLVYLLRHTQMLPRDLLDYLNEIARLGWEDENNPLRFSEQDVLAGVRSKEVELCKQIMEGYAEDYWDQRSMRRIFETLLPNLPFAFTWEDFGTVMRDHESVLKYEDNPGRIVHRMIRMGVLGIQIEESDQYSVASFEIYENDEKIHTNDQDVFCIHPQFIERFRMYVAEQKRNKNPKPVLPMTPQTKEIMALVAEQT